MYKVPGFRSYHQLSDAHERLDRLYGQVTLLAAAAANGFENAQTAAKDSISLLIAAEERWYAAADARRVKEAKAREIDFLKASIDNCIIHGVSRTRAAFTWSPSWREPLWRESTVLAAEADEIAKSVQHLQPYNHFEQRAAAMVRELKHSISQSKVGRILDARAEITDLGRVTARLEALHRQLRVVVPQFQAAAGRFKHILSAAERGKKLLNIYAELITAESPAEGRDLVSEERELLAFITTAASYNQRDDITAEKSHNYRLAPPAVHASSSLAPRAMTGKEVLCQIFYQPHLDSAKST